MAFARLQSSVALLLLAVGGVAGCLDDAPGFRVPFPFSGASAAYTGSDGSLLSVRIVGVDERLGPFQERREVIVLEYVLNPAKRPDAQIRFEESVDRATGLHLRQDVDCLFATELPENPADTCKPGFIQAFLGGHGLPGALGMGPIWGRTLSPAEPVNVDITQAAFGATSLTYSVDKVPGCVRLEAKAAPRAPDLASWMPGTVLHGPFVACERNPLPAQFQSHMKMPSAFSDEEFPVFTQTGRSDHSGGDPIRPSESDGGSNGGVTGSFSGQTYLLSDDERFTNFSSVKAHEEALRLDDRYYDAFERGGLVVFASFGQGGSRSLAAGAIREEFSQWHLVIATTGSDFHEARVQQVHTTWLDGHRETTYSLVSSPAPPWDGEMPMAIAGKPFVDPARAYELGDRVFQEPLIGATHASITTNNGIYSFPHVTADDRFWVTAGYKPPDTPADAQVITPWLVTIDASTGAVVRLQTAPEHRGSL